MSALHSARFDSVGPDQSSPSWSDHALSGLAEDLEAFRASRPSPARFEIQPAASWADSDPAVPPADPAAATAVQPGPAGEGVLSPSQAELLRQLTRAEGPVSADDLDGRVLRALCRRGLVAVEEGHARATAEGRHHFETKVRKRRRVRSERLVPSDAEERAETILQVVRQLETALPRNMRHAVGDLDVDTPELLAALEEYALQLRSGLA